MKREFHSVESRSSFTKDEKERKTKVNNNSKEENEKHRVQIPTSSLGLVAAESLALTAGQLKQAQI